MGEEGEEEAEGEEGRPAPDGDPWRSLGQRRGQLRAQAAEVHEDSPLAADSWVRHGGGLVVVLRSGYRSPVRFPVCPRAVYKTKPKQNLIRDILVREIMSQSFAGACQAVGQMTQLASLLI